jgi:hypothetical protein
MCTTSLKFQFADFGRRTATVQKSNHVFIGIQHLRRVEWLAILRKQNSVRISREDFVRWESNASFRMFQDFRLYAKTTWLGFVRLVLSVRVCILKVWLVRKTWVCQSSATFLRNSIGPKDTSLLTKCTSQPRRLFATSAELKDTNLRTARRRNWVNGSWVMFSQRIRRQSGRPRLRASVATRRVTMQTHVQSKC